MELDINTTEVLLALNRVAGIVEKTGPTSHVKFETLDDSVVFSATDQQYLTLVAEYPANVEKKGTIVIKASRFMQIARSIAGETIHVLEQSNQKVLIQSGKAKFDIHECLPVLSFPPVEEKKLIAIAEISNSDLKRVIDETSFSISPDKASNSNLSGAAFELVNVDNETRLRIVTTDTNRLSCSEALFNVDEQNIDIFNRFWLDEKNLPAKVVPKKAILQIRRLCDAADSNWTIAIDENKKELILKNDNMELGILLNDSKFPPYRIIIDRIKSNADKRRVALVNKADIADVMRRAKIFCTQNNHSVTLHFESDRIVVDIKNPDIGSFEEVIPVQLEGEPSSIGFNFNYLQDIIQSVESDQFRFNFGDKTDPCLIDVVDRNDCLFIVMPMRSHR